MMRTTADRTKFGLISGDFVKTGGMDRANYALADYLLAAGHPVDFVAYRVAAELLERSETAFHRVRKPLNSYLLGHNVLSRAAWREASRIAVGGGRVVVNGGNCRWGDVNWLHHLNVLDAPLSGGGPLRQCHRHLAYRLYVHEDRAALRNAATIITTCERNKSDLIHWLGTPAERIHTIYYGIDSDLFHPADLDERAALRDRFGWPQDRPVLAFVGAMGDRRKGFDTLFQAWLCLCRRPDWDAQLVVVGRGAELPAWQARAAEEGIGNRIDFLGFRKDVPDLMRASDAHVPTLSL